MQIFFSLILLLALLTFIPTSQAGPKLLIVTDTWPPYVFEENDAPTGFDYEVMMVVLEKMGYGVDFLFLPWKRCIEMVKAQQADGILDIGKNQAREEFMHFPAEPLSESTSFLFHLRQNYYPFTRLEDLGGLTIGTILGYKYNTEFLEADYFKREPVKTEEQNFQKLLHGRIDLLLTNRNVGLFTARKMGLLDRVAYIPKPLSSGSNYLAFAKKPGYEQLAEHFSLTLASFKQSGEYQLIMERYGQR